MTELKYSEIFYSLQGEGLFMGVPSVFLRTFGCNFRCKSFGLSSPVYGRYNPEVKQLIDSGVIEETLRFEDLPLVHTGCDTYASIYPEFSRFSQTGDVTQVINDILKLLPNGEWIMNKNDIHLILTGGEPMLWQPFWVELFKNERMSTLKNITIETNGTQKISNDFLDCLNKAPFNVTWSCSPKLSVSGEPRNKAIKPSVIKKYMDVIDSNIYLKFVVSSDTQDELIEVINDYNNNGIDCPVYIMPTGGCIEEYKQNEKLVADLAIQNGWRFSPRLQLMLYGNQWGT